MKIVRLDSGPVFDIYGLIIEGVCLVEEYIEGLDEKDQIKIFSLFERILQHGPPQNITRFRHIGDGIYELKTSSGNRILSFYGGESLPNSLILAQGFQKSKKKILDRQKRKALRWREPIIEIVKSY